MTMVQEDTNTMIVLEMPLKMSQVPGMGLRCLFIWRDVYLEGYIEQIQF